MNKYLQIAVVAAASIGSLSTMAAIPSGYTVTPANNATVKTLSVITVAKSGSMYHDPYINRTITVNGEKIAVTQKAVNGGKAVEMTLSSAIDQSGTYKIEVPARMFTWDMMGDEDNPAMSWTVIVDNPDKPAAPSIVVTASPASGATVSTLDKVTVNFEGADDVVLSDAAVVKATVSYNGTPMENTVTLTKAVGASIVMSVATPLTASGDYTFTIPVGTLQLTAGTLTFGAPEVKLNYTVKAPLKDGDMFIVDKLRYQVLSTKDNTIALTFPDFKNGGSEEDYAHLTTLNTKVLYEGTNYTLTEIGDLALSEVKGLKNFIVPEGIVRIGMGAFWESTVETVKIPSTVIEIGESCFEDCKGLKEFDLPATVTVLGTDVFCGCAQLKTITLPEGMTSIPNGFLQGCVALTKVNIPSSVTMIGELALSECEMLSETNIPDGVTKLGKFAYAYTPALRTLPIPSSVNEMGNGVFYQSGIQESVLPETITVIPNGTYQCCANLKEFIVGDNVTAIEPEVFFWCFGLTRITLGAQVATIGKDVFLKDEALTEVVCRNPVPATGAVFEPAVYANARLIVPKESLEAYSTAPGWKEFKNIIPDLSSGVENTVANAYTIDGRTITLHNAGTVTNADGSIVFSGTGSVTLSSGIYIITLGNNAVKVML